MTRDFTDVFPAILHIKGKLQEAVLRAKTNSAAKPQLHWGQFIAEYSRDDMQVGVYGSSCAAIIAKDRDDAFAREARQQLFTYVTTARDANSELAHNIKLAMIVLALSPPPGQDADQKMLNYLSELLSRCSQVTKLWPAYTPTSEHSTVRFVPRDSEVVTSIIIILLNEVYRCLEHPAKYGQERAQIKGQVEASATALEQAYATKQPLVGRFFGLTSSAVILVKGRTANKMVRRAFREAVRTRDFSDRRVLFYDCLRNGTLTRDYFIVPIAVVLPIVADKSDAKSIDRALAFIGAEELVRQLDGSGLFRTGQEYSSTVEQLLVYLSLKSVCRGKKLLSTIWDQAALSWLHITQSGPTGVPTRQISVLVILLWIVTAAAILGKLIPVGLRSLPGLSYIYEFASFFPEAITAFLVFLVGALPASKALFLRLMEKKLQ